MSRERELKQIEEVIAAGPFVASWESLSGYQVPAWYEDAKLGIFIHWGVYAVPAVTNEWYAREMYRPGTREFKHHVATYGPQAQFGYKDFIPQFRAEKYDPEAWASLFASAGAKFVVPVAEHHDGFAMYDSALSAWTAANMGPKRDVVGDLAAAVRRRGLVFGASNHRAEHWWFFDGGRTFDSDVQDPRYDGLYGPARPAPANLLDDKQSPPDEAYLRDWLVRVCELVDLYRPQLLWFDWWIQNQAFAPFLQKFGAYYYNRGAQWGQGVVINYKLKAFAEGCAVLDIERGRLPGIRPMVWQTDTSISHTSWGYITDQSYKSTTTILHDFLDIVSKNGVLLLNVGPRPDGTIPEPEQQVLREIGDWLAVNGEAIYGARPWRVFGEGPTRAEEGERGVVHDTKESAFTGEDVRFTAKGDVTYAICLGWPEHAWQIHSLGAAAGTVAEVTLLGSKEKVRWSQGREALQVEAPSRRPCEHAYVLKIGMKK